MLKSETKWLIRLKLSKEIFGNLGHLVHPMHRYLIWDTRKIFGTLWANDPFTCEAKPSKGKMHCPQDQQVQARHLLVRINCRSLNKPPYNFLYNIRRTINRNLLDAKNLFIYAALWFLAGEFLRWWHNLTIFAMKMLFIYSAKILERLGYAQFLQSFEIPALFSHFSLAEKRVGISKPCKNCADPSRSNIFCILAYLKIVCYFFDTSIQTLLMFIFQHRQIPL